MQDPQKGKSKKRKQRQDVDLRAAAGHVSYEIRMLVFAGKRLPSYHSSPAGLGEDDKNMALETFLLHFRNLRAFLCPEKELPRADDVIASDFLDKTLARDLADSDLLSVDRERLNKMLAHLSYSRRKYIQLGTHAWDVLAMLRVMLDQFEAFLVKLPPARRAWFPEQDWFAEARGNMDSLLKSLIADAGPSAETDE